MKEIKTIIIDDEPLAIHVLEEYIEKVGHLKLERTFSNAIEACTFLQDNPIDLIFLDINMPVLDGFSFLESLKNKPMTVITSAHEEYALKSYEVEALDYLVKPIPFPRFLKTANRAASLFSKGQETATNNQSIFVKIDNKRLQKIYLDEILVVESLKDYIRIKTTSDKYIVHKTLTGFTEELPEKKFIRIHRSYTIAIEKIQAIEGNSITIDGMRYTIGRSYQNAFKENVLNEIQG